MEIFVTFSDHPAVKDSLIVDKKVGSGKFSVYKVHSPKHRENYALKVFPKSPSGATQYKKEQLMFKLNHPNIIQRIPVQCHRDDFYALVTEYAKHGDFFELVINGLINSEVLVRTYFHQLIEGLEYIHSQGIAHLDLKLENLMLGSDFQLKIIDFDQAQLISDGNITSGGSQGYRAPEVRLGSCDNLEAADIFSAGVILYAFKAVEFPFLEMKTPKADDYRCYSYFVKKNKSFWQKRAELKKNATFFSIEFIHLVNSMLYPKPNRRATIEEIKSSKWYQGPILDAVALKSEMKANIEAIMRKQKLPELNRTPRIKFPVSPSNKFPVSPSNKIPTPPPRKIPIVTSCKFF